MTGIVIAAFALLLPAIFSAVKADPGACRAIGNDIDVTENLGVIKSPTLESGQELENVRCLWNMNANEKFIELTVSDVDLRPNSQCTSEYLEISYEGSVEPYLRYCGQVAKDKVVISAESNPSVLFVTDGMRSDKPRRFTLEYRLVDKKPDCGSDSFMCPRPPKCISSKQVCDGISDCFGGEDEVKCGHKVIQPSECGIPKIPPDMDRIVGGQEAVPGSWPWLASVQGNYIWPSGHACGAAILNNLYVLTAAHCVVGRYFKAFRVKFGDHNQYKDEEGEFTRDLETFYLHPNYNRFDASDDLAILKLAAPIVYSDKVSPICLPDPEEALPAGSLLYAAGWGTTESGENSDVLKQVELPLIDFDTCKTMVRRKLPLRTICTGHEGGGKNPCFGDSGGPLMNRRDGRWVLQGAVSWGPTTCGLADEAAVYSKIADHVQWIRKTIQE